METRLHVERVSECLKIAGEAGKVLYQEMKMAVEERTKRLVQSMEMAPKAGFVGSGFGAGSGNRDVEMEEDMET